MKCHHKPRTLITGQLERKCIKNKKKKKSKNGMGRMNMVSVICFVCVYLYHEWKWLLANMMFHIVCWVYVHDNDNVWIFIYVDGGGGE